MRDLKLGVSGIILLLLGVALFFFVLNYFNILSLSKLYPDKLASLPHKSTANRLLPVYPSPSPTILTSVPCPIDPQFCSTGRLIATTSAGIKFYALAYTLPAGTNLKAVFNGFSIEAVESGLDVKPHLVIDFKKQKGEQIIADYNFFGTKENSLEDDPSHGYRLFKIGQTIATIGKSQLKGAEGGTNFPNRPPLNGANFLFSVKQGDKIFNLKLSGDKIELKN